MKRRKITESDIRSIIREEIMKLDEAHSPYNIPATITSDRMGNIIVEFEYDGEMVDDYLQRSQEIKAFMGYFVPDERGVDSVDQALEEAQNGYEVDVLLYDEYAHQVYMNYMEGF